MFSLEADVARNLLKMTFSGHIREQDLKDRDGEMEKALSELRPGFRFLGNLTDLQSMEPACLPYIRHNMDVLNKRGVTKVVRIIPDPRKDIGLNILSVFHYRRGIPIVTCASLGEAEAALKE